jgi:hypothetical protein
MFFTAEVQRFLKFIRGHPGKLVGLQHEKVALSNKM